MKVIRLVCAENIIRDIQTNQIVVYNLYDEIKSTTYPILLNKFCIYVLASREEGDSQNEYSCIFKIKNSEEILFQDDFQLNFKDNQTAKSVIKFSGLAVPNSGDLKVEIYDNDGETLLNEYLILLSLRRITKKISE